MLLYDHVREYAELALRRYGEEVFGHRNMQNLNALRHCAVYDATDIVPLFSDWSRDKDKPIAKKPPHDPTWVEWRFHDCTDDGKYFDDWSLGVIVAELPRDTRELLASMPAIAGSGGMSPSEFFNKEKDFYAVQMFKRLDGFNLNPDRSGHGPDGRELSYDQRFELNKAILHVPSCDLGTFIWSQNSDGTGIHRFKIFPTASKLDGEDGQISAQDATIFFLPVCGSFGFSSYWQPADPWPAFMAFSLLHCKNVVTEDHVPDAKTQRRVAKSGNPPRVTFKTLQIEVPSEAQSRGVYEGDEEDTGPKVRFHLCSGHFKHLTSERYKSKRGQWIWCPAHWKGSKELGEVHKRYALSPRQEDVQ